MAYAAVVVSPVHALCGRGARVGLAEVHLDLAAAPLVSGTAVAPVSGHKVLARPSIDARAGVALVVLKLAVVAAVTWGRD